MTGARKLTWFFVLGHNVARLKEQKYFRWLWTWILCTYKNQSPKDVISQLLKDACKIPERSERQGRGGLVALEANLGATLKVSFHTWEEFNLQFSFFTSPGGRFIIELLNIWTFKEKTIDKKGCLPGPGGSLAVEHSQLVIDRVRCYLLDTFW